MAVSLSNLLPTPDSINLLKLNVVIISELSAMTLDNLLDTDVFTFARQPNTLSANRNIQKRHLDNFMSNKLFNDNLTIKGKWEYAINKDSGLCIDYNSVKNGPADTVINRKYLENDLLREIDDLSDYIFNQDHVPSIVGDVIFSLRLNTEAKVKEVYGGSKWRRLNDNDIVIGIGKCQANNMTKFGTLEAGAMNISLNDTGGEESVRLNTGNVASHIHRFTANSTNFNFKWEYKISDEILNKITSSSVKNQFEYYEMDGYHAATSTVGGSVKVRGKTTISTASIYRSLSMTNDLYDENTNKGGNEAHNNMPPVICAYVWIRER